MQSELAGVHSRFWDPTVSACSLRMQHQALHVLRSSITSCLQRLLYNLKITCLMVERIYHNPIDQRK